MTTIITAIDSRYYAILLREKKKNHKKKTVNHYKEELEKEKFWQSGDRNISCICESLLKSHFLFVHHHLAQCEGLPSVLTLCVRPGETV